ncbi:MAG: hypothetical protein KTR31_38190 [Myxococcales bacterium]|nr:hypothetical protein [Myxococcales bacterium]
MSTDDPWLDAFDLDELDDPDLRSIDDAVARLKQQVTPAPPRRSRGWMWLGLAAALAAGALLGVGWGQQRPIDTAPVVARPLPAPEATPPTPERKPPTPDATAAPPEPRVVEQAPREPAPPKEPGLEPHPNATVRLQDDAAVLVTGTLRYVHDATHDPGVTQVRWDRLPLVATPIGTVFTVASEGDLAALTVSVGQIRLTHSDGRVLTTLDAGQEVAVFADPQSPNGLRVMALDGMPLDQVDDLLDGPEAKALVSVVALLRLHGVGRTLLPDEP